MAWCLMRDGVGKKSRHATCRCCRFDTPNISANGWIDAVVRCNLVLDSQNGKLPVLEVKELA